MFTALIVDDEEFSLKTIRRMIDWTVLGVSRVLEASNGYKAQQILKNNRVNLMICDIEMPQMDGLELVEWLREEQMETEVIILTCHDSFDMVQKALHLGSVEYILKPVSPAAIQECVKRALEVWQGKEEYRGASLRWDNSISFRRTQYFTDIIHRNISSSPGALLNYAELYGLSFGDADRIHLALVCVENIGIPVKDMQDFMYSLQNAAAELWNAASFGWNCMIRDGESAFWLLGGSAGRERAEEEFSLQFEKFAAEHHMRVEVYTAKPCTVNEIGGQAEWLKTAHERRQFFYMHTLKDDIKEQERIWHRTKTRWQVYVENGSFALIREEIMAVLGNLSGSPAQRDEYLKKMRNALLEVVKECVQRGKEQIGDLQEEGLFYNESGFLIWMEWLLQKVKECENADGSYSGVVDEICRYVTMNIHKDISREAVAAVVHLNPDYVARLFKKETGLTLNSYIVKKRIKLATQLLAYTEVPVGDISVSLGYSSFSHFTKIFKESQGVTPSEYRRLNKKGG